MSEILEQNKRKPHVEVFVSRVAVSLIQCLREQRCRYNAAAERTRTHTVVSNPHISSFPKMLSVASFLSISLQHRKSLFAKSLGAQAAAAATAVCPLSLAASIYKVTSLAANL